MMGAVRTLGEPGEGVAPERAVIGRTLREVERMRARTRKNERETTHEPKREQGSTPRSTQLRGSPKVIIPLLLHLLCIYDQIWIESYNGVHPLRVFGF